MTLAAGAWLVVAVVLVVAEILSPGLVCLPFAVGAACALGLELAGVASTWQWIAFVGVSSVLFVVAQRFVRGRR